MNNALEAALAKCHAIGRGERPDSYRTSEQMRLHGQQVRNMVTAAKLTGLPINPEYEMDFSNED